MTKNRSFSGGISERYALALLELSNEANKTDEYVSILSSFMTIYNSDDKYLSNKRKELPQGLWVGTNQQSFYSQYPKFWIDQKGYII